MSSSIGKSTSCKMEKQNDYRGSVRDKEMFF